MRKFLKIISFLLLAINLYSQGRIGIGTNNPDQSAILHLQATDKGFLIPNMTEVERIAIISPANGLMVYQRDGDNPGIYINKSSNPAIPSWKHLMEGINLWQQSVNTPVNIHTLNSGNVGIGVFDAGQKLSVAGGITLDATNQNNGSFDNTLKFGSDNSGTMIRSVRNTGTNQLGLDLMTNFNTRIGITNGGNVGIGLNSPVNKLDVEGGVVVGATYSGTNTAPSNGLLVEGNTGLGTTSPINKLDVEGSVVIGATYSGTNTAPTNGLLVQGNVGIGTTNPLTRLNVKGNGYGYIHSDNADTVQLGSYITTNAGWLGTKTNHPLHFFTNDGSPKMTLASNGNIGIGTQTPHNFAALEVSATNKGILLPRLNNTQMGALGTAATDGTIVYNTDQSGLFLRRSGSFVKLIDVAATITLPFSSTVNSSSNLFTVQNSGTGGAVWATTNSNTDAAMHAETNGAGRAFEAISTSGIAGYFSTSGSSNIALSVGLGKTGLGTLSPVNQLDVEGAVAIGASYSGTNTAPANGAIIQGTVGIGTNSPNGTYMLDVNGRMRLRHNVNTSGLWFNKSNNTEEAFIGMVNDTTWGLWGSVGSPNWRNSFNLRNGNMGINVTNPLKPLSFDNNLGNKIALWGNGDTDHYGLGVVASTMRLYVPNNTARFEFGYGNANAFIEKARLTASGQFLLGIQSSTFNAELNSANSSSLLLTNNNNRFTGMINKLSFKSAGLFDASIRTITTGLFTARLGFFTNSDVVEGNLIERMSITDAGDVLIGTTNETSGAGYKLRVAGKIISEELKVQLQASWPDYVFKNNYKKMGLSELETFIHDNNRLPNIPAASEIEKNGLEVGEMQRKMMEKIEELTLYIIELNKKLESQELEIASLKNKN